MKNILKRKKKNLLKNEKGQGMVEYILLLVVVIGIIAVFKPRIMKAFESAMGKTEGGVTEIIQ